jgi:DNA-directed RNA polymerase subunit RPC12/RpoP
MSYESPIELLITDIQHQIVEQQDEQIYQAVMNVIPNINKEELLRALKYDRDQYDRGYEDGKRDSVVHARWDRRDESYCCTNCGAEAIHHDLSEETVAWYMTRHCPDCGARMDAGVSE